MKTALALVLALTCATARADNTAGRRAELAADYIPGRRAQLAAGNAANQLRRLRLEGSQDRHTEGLWLLSWGAANVVGGGLAIGFGHDDEAWVGAGVAAASFGAVNALLAFGILDLSGSKRKAALSLTATDPQTLQRLRQQQLVAELHSGQFYAVNFGLDVAYLTAGVFLYVLGRESTPKSEWVQGAGISIIGQGAFLLVFDLVAWIGANRRADAFRVQF